MLVIEDGTVVPGAASFISYADAVIEAANYGVTFSDDETTGQVHLRGAYLWLVNLYESNLQGLRMSGQQTGIFPRDGVTARNFKVEDNVIPGDVILAQVFAASALSKLRKSALPLPQ